MAGVTQGRAGRGGIVGINVTPMVDVVLVLLIIMMVSATYIVSQSLKVQLPKTASSDETVAKTYVVTVTKEGTYYFNDKPISRDGLQKELLKFIHQRAGVVPPFFFAPCWKIHFPIGALGDDRARA